MILNTAERDTGAVAMELMCRHGGIGQAAMGKALGGLDYTTVSLERKRLRKKVRQNKVLARAVSGTEERLINK